MAGNDSSDSPVDPAAGYEDQDLAERTRHGLTVDRHDNIVDSNIFDSLWKARKSDDLGPPPDPGRFLYGASRNLLWQTRRLANAKLANKTNTHKQLLMCWCAVMLDLLADSQPTVKDWNMLTGKDDRQTRRTKGRAPQLVHDLDQILKWVVRKQDGTGSVTPLKPARESPKDERVQLITTPYSSPGASRARFDRKVFADPAYINRQGVFWEDALTYLSKWIGKGSAIRPDGEWLVWHIVNNDIAMHVIFDNLSFVCEVNWFEKLSDKGKYEVAGKTVRTGYETVPFTKEESKAHMDEAMKWIRAATDCPPGESYALRVGDKDIPIDSAEVRKGMEVITQLVREITDANGGLRRPIQELRHVPHPFTGEDAEKAVDELAVFVADFEEKVPENLRKYMIGQDRMESRVQDMVLETITDLSMSSSAEERSAAEAMTKRFSERFCRSRPGSGSRSAAGSAGRRDGRRD